MEQLDKPFLRNSLRIPVSIRGTLSDGQTSTPCLVHDMSNSGLLLLCTEPYAEGQVLELVCDNPRGKSFSCTVEVRHRDNDAMGVVIRAIHSQSAEGFRLYTQAGDPQR